MWVAADPNIRFRILYRSSTELETPAAARRPAAGIRRLSLLAEHSKQHSEKAVGFNNLFTWKFAKTNCLMIFQIKNLHMP